MLAADDAREAIRKLLRRCLVADLERLYRTLETRSRMSVLRRLAEVDYTTSYTHTSRYYTLADVPQYDEHGLWFHGDIGFSRARTLGATIVGLVDGSPRGFTYSELRAVLRTRVENALVRLVRGDEVRRGSAARRPLYLSADPGRAREQVAAREALATVKESRLPSADVEIDVLVEVIRTSGLVVPREADVRKRLHARGVTASAAQVRSVFAKYGLEAGKKTKVSRSTCSRM